MKIVKALRVSPSGLVSFLKCSMQYKWQELDELMPDPGTDNLYAVLGKSIHKASELCDLYSFSLKELEQSWEVLFFSILSESKNLPTNTAQNVDKFLASGLILLRNVFKLKQRWKDSIIVDVEKYCRVAYKNPYIEDVNLSGRIDLLIKNKNNVYTAIDWKTSKTACKNIFEDIQMMFYIYFVHVTYKIPYSDIFGALVYPALEKVLFVQHTEDEIKQMIFPKVDKMLQIISENKFQRDPKISKTKDNCFFCGYSKSCERL